MPFTDGKIIVWNDGEALTFGDLNDGQKGPTQRAWEWPGYAQAIPHAIITTEVFESVFDSAIGLDQMVFYKGAGPGLYKAGLTLNVGAGFLGIYKGTLSPDPLDPQMAWIYINASEALPLDAAPPGQKRYDAITLDITESDGDPESREFEDEVTGAKTTESLNKHRIIAGAFNVIQGAPDASPTPPDATGQHVVALVLVNETEIEDVHDAMMPFGSVHTHLTRGGLDSLYSVGEFGADWEVGSHTFGVDLFLTWRLKCLSSASGVHAPKAVLSPKMFGGDATAKLIAIEIGATLDPASTIQLITLRTDGVDTELVLDDLTAAFAASPRIDLRGYPFVSGQGPVFGDGLRVKIPQQTEVTDRMPALLFTGKTNDEIKWVKWHFVKG